MRVPLLLTILCLLGAPMAGEALGAPLALALTPASPAPPLERTGGTGSATRRKGLKARKPTPPEAPEQGDFALAINLPVDWSELFGASAYVGVIPRHAIRLNVASYQPLGLEDEIEHKGRTTDFGIGSVWYLTRRFSGLFVEAGPLLRFRDVSKLGPFGDGVATDTTIYAGRALVGVSALLGEHFFIAAAVGCSLGYETGRERIIDGNGPETEARVRRLKGDAEAYLRFGIAFGTPIPGPTRRPYRR